MPISRYRNVATGVALALLGGGTLGVVSSFPWDIPPATDPALFPRIVAVGLIVVGLVIVATALVNLRTGKVTDDDADGMPVDVEVSDEVARDAPEEGSDWRSTLVLAIVIGIYCLTAFWIGFVVMTVVFLATVALLLGHSRQRRGLVTLAIFTVVTTALFYFGFFTLLGVRMPSTLLF